MNQIAIVGMAGRFPGASSVAELWERIRNAEDCITHFRDDDLLAAGVDPALLQREDYIKAGAILSDIQGFDAGFFGMSPAEAELIDPQHRIFLEIAWEALEEAGCDPQVYQGSIGIFAGSTLSTYLLYNIMPERGFASPDDIATLAANDKDYLATRVAHQLDLRGPALNIQTACSTSLVAVHLAAQALLNGECDLALAGGVSIRTPQTRGYYYREGGISSPDGRTCSFAEGAQGTVTGNGAGVVVLKRLEDALEDGDIIDAVILGSAVNNDGSGKVSFSAPAVEGQASVISEALHIAETTPDEIALIEAHGTGTEIGDPIELTALQQAFREQTTRKHYCAVGSIKSNVGHLETAAGVTGLIKAVMALKHHLLPPSLHCEQPTTRFNFAASPFYVNTKVRPWTQTPRRAGVSSFGVGGSNAHLILGEAPAQAAPMNQDPGPWLLTLSARDDAALRALAERTAFFLVSEDVSPAQVAYSAVTRRSHHACRLAVTGETAHDVHQALEAWRRGEPQSSASYGKAPKQTPKIAFIFSGQGGQWLGMGRQLIECEEVFRDHIDACDRILQSQAGWSLLHELYAAPPESHLSRTDICQPMIFAIQSGLALVLRHYGITPDAVMGHSMGEVAAAFTAGALELKDALCILSERARAVDGLERQGGMALVELGEAETETSLQELGLTLSIAAVNSPQATVVSGDLDDLEQAIAEWEAKGLFTRRINTNYASHSPHMDSLLPDLAEHLAKIRPRSAARPMFSTIEQRFLDGRELDARYWCGNLRGKVNLYPAVQHLIQEDFRIFIEVGPHPLLRASLHDIFAEAEVQAQVLSPLFRDQDDRHTLRQTLGQCYVSGCAPQWHKLFPSGGRFTRLPTYPWQRKVYWIGEQGYGYDPHHRPGELRKALQQKRSDHGCLIGEAHRNLRRDDEWTWRPRFDSSGHVNDRLPTIGGVAQLHAFASLALAYTALQNKGEHGQLTKLTWADPPALDHERRQRQAQIHLAEGQLAIAIHEEDGWRAVLDAEIASSLDPAPDVDLHYIRQRRMTRVGGDQLNDALKSLGIDVVTRPVTELRCNREEALAEIKPVPQTPTILSLLEAAYQLCQFLSARHPRPAQLIPIEARTVHFSGNLGDVTHIYVRIKGERHGYQGLILFLNADDEIQGFIDDLSLETQDEIQTQESDDLADWFYQKTWKVQQKAVASALLNGVWLYFVGRHNLPRQTAEAMSMDPNVRVIFVEPGPDFSELDRNHFRVNSLYLDNFQKLFDHIPRPDHIVHGWSLEISEPETWPTFCEAQALACGSLMHLVQTLSKLEYEPRLWLLTRGAYAYGQRGPRAVHGATVWGLGLNLIQEHPELKPKLIDVGQGEDRETCEALIREYRLEDGAMEIALRGHSRLTARIERHQPQPAETPPLCRAYASYLITGGLGGIGLTAAQWLADHGAMHLILIGRSEPKEDARKVIDQLGRRGVQVLTIAADVRSEARLAEILDAVGRTMPPLAGVLHMAAVIDDNIMLSYDWDRFEAVLGAKAYGAWALHRLTIDLRLDFFICFSSIVSMMGSHGQGAYTAANAFLDALAHHRNSLGLPGLSVNWGAWGEVGRARDVGDSKLNRRLAGLRRMPPEKAFAALDILLNAAGVQVAVVDGFDARAWCRGRQDLLTSPAFASLVETPTRPEKSGGRLRDTLEETPLEGRREHLSQWLRLEMSRLLKVSEQDFDVATPFAEYGFNSLMSLEFRGRLKRELGVNLSAVLTYNYPTVQLLTDHLASKLGFDTPPPESEPKLESELESKALSDEIDIEALSEAEAEALLLKELDELG